MNDGVDLQIKDLNGIHLVWCDIMMLKENGDAALARLSKEAVNKFYLPTFVAITTEEDYLNNSKKTEEAGFLFARNKIHKKDIGSILEKCENDLGSDWLETKIGHFQSEIAQKDSSNTLATDSSLRPATSGEFSSRELAMLIDPNEIEQSNNDPVGLDLDDINRAELRKPTAPEQDNPIIFSGNRILPGCALEQPPRMVKQRKIFPEDVTVTRRKGNIRTAKIAPENEQPSKRFCCLT